MSKTVRILGITGRRQSYNRGVVRAVTQLAPEDATIEILEIDGIPLFNENEQDLPTNVVELRRRVRAADAILFVTPEYNYSNSGALKHAIDWVSQPFGDNLWSGKPAAVLSASTGELRAANAQYHLRQVMVSLNMFPLNQPELIIGAANERFDTVGKLSGEERTEYVGLVVQSLVDWTRRIGKKESSTFHEHQKDYENERLFAFI